MQGACAILSATSLAAPCFSSVSHKRHDFQKKKKLMNRRYVFSFSVQTLFGTFLIRGRIQRDIVISVKTSSYKVPVILVEFNET